MYGRIDPWRVDLDLLYGQIEAQVAHRQAAERQQQQTAEAEAQRAALRRMGR